MSRNMKSLSSFSVFLGFIFIFCSLSAMDCELFRGSCEGYVANRCFKSIGQSLLCWACSDQLGKISENMQGIEKPSSGGKWMAAGAQCEARFSDCDLAYLKLMGSLVCFCGYVVTAYDGPPTHSCSLDLYRLATNKTAKTFTGCVRLLTGTHLGAYEKDKNV